MPTVDSTSSSSATQFSMIGLVVGFGTLGGLIAWILQASTGGRLLPWAWYGSIPAAMVLGAGASGIGVYVLANTDLEQKGRALFFALLCGVFFKPVWQAGSDFINGAISQAKAQSQLTSVRTDAGRLSQSVRTASTEKVKSDVTKTADGTAGLVQQTADVSNSDARKTLEANAVQAVKTITAAAPRAPEASVDGLYKIGLAAKQSGQTGVTLQVLSSLHQIEASSADPAAAKKARQAAGEIVARSPSQ